ncbi:MAG: DUF2723 domain-containing protein [Chloroflexi bacterium]|nr:DUF2723 domain-containing protein [Chloroflexota bacterium]MCL5273834.1 DUF2723 domain-containing protein [Chloroflexota bacterium]
MRQLRWANTAIHLVLFVSALALYIYTLNPDVQPADSGEFQIAAITLGIPHPPGYPLYTMLGWLFAQAPISTPFARVSLLSAVASAATLVLTSLTVQSLFADTTATTVSDTRTKSRLPGIGAGIIAAVALGTSTTFWAQATTTNIRSLTAFFTALMVYAVVHLQGSTRRYPLYMHRVRTDLALFALALGLGVGHHVSLIFVGIVLSAYVLFLLREIRLNLKSLIPALLALIATQLVWLYLPLRDAVGARFAPGNLTTVNGLFYHIFARGFAGDMLAFAAPQYLLDRISIIPTLFLFEFSLSVLVVTAIGVVLLLARRNAAIIVLVVAVIVHLFITITYRAPQTVEYAIPVWVMLCMLLGAGMAEVSSVLIRASRYATQRWAATMTAPSLSLVSNGAGCIVLLVAAGVVAVDGLGRLPSFVEIGRGRSTRTNATAALTAAPRNSAILAQWHQATPMWALQDIEGLRPDITVEYVYPHGAQPYAYTFADQAAASAVVSPTLVTGYYPAAYQAKGIIATPVHNLALWKIQTTPIRAPVDLHSLLAEFDKRIGIISLEAPREPVQTGQAINMLLTWAAFGKVVENESLTVRFMRDDGRLAANADARLDPHLPLSASQSLRLTLGIPMDILPGTYRLLIGAYRSEPDGFAELKDATGVDFVDAGELRVVPAAQAAASMHPMSQRLPDGAVLTGADYDTGIPGKWRLLTHWQLGDRPLTITVQNAGDESLAAPRVLPSIRYGIGFLTLAYDIPPTRQVHLAVAGMNETLTIPDASDGDRYIPFADQMVLVGSSTTQNAGQLKVDLRWLSARSITSDFIVSVRVEGVGFHAAHDGEPALGALPTLKWIRGSLITDRHPFALGNYQGALDGTVVVYDAFTEQNLPPLDERYDTGVTIPVK